MSNQKAITEFLRSYEKSGAKKLRELQSTQSFSGTLKINTDRVYVDQKDGRRALEHLKKLRGSSVAKVK